jgi:biotin carboxyl carrier protein
LKLSIGGPRVKREISIGGTPHTVELERTGDALTFRFDENPAGTASIAGAEPGVYSVLLNGRSYRACVTRSAQGIAVEVGGQIFEIEILDPRAPRRQSSGLPGEGKQTLIAPMPGKIVRILIAQGDTVETGQGLIVIEAMKMQNELKALRPGRVVSLAVAEGAAVAAGDVLAVVE